MSKTKPTKTKREDGEMLFFRTTGQIRKAIEAFGKRQEVPPTLSACIRVLVEKALRAEGLL